MNAATQPTLTESLNQIQPAKIEGEALWFKDALIYQTHIKAFADSNGDGIGDFAGLISKLDYIQELGVSTIWLLPFYPSPLRDDGYDIAEYREVNPTYGTLDDVRVLIEEVHKRGLKIVTELVINHTSDQHPWFQRARMAPAGSPERDYYVWSDTDKQYADTRIIFIDTEKSNWTWDPEAKAYFWHRFYSHQPDLNFDNPAVMEEVLSVLHYWLDMGIDGLRLDAIPYLIEREGTNCENLPETHVVLKRIRAEIDEHYQGRMLLAEANQWPEDTFPYFGEGNECHMGFHFPLMPRMYMAIAQEDRHPITDIMRQTPDIPENCQWAIFLRNHDELTLEMVTQNEREYLWNTYAADRRMRINLGIRRRLAPLMDNDRRKIELMNALLLSMPGTPIIYYGDEIGMGDNIYLGDRDGVRTPMQWSPDRNGGFSRANPQRLYLPAIQDPIFGYQAVNVEAQQQSPGSLLNWMKRVISVRQARRTFGRGSQTFLYPRNRKILAYLREHEGETVLCAFNLSRNAQAFELDLSRYIGRVPIELLGRTAFPQVTDPCYRLALPGYGFYWFVLSDSAQSGGMSEPTPEPLPEFITVVLTYGYRGITEGRVGRDLEQQVLVEFLPKQRWFGAKDRTVQSAKLVATTDLQGSGAAYLLMEVEVALAGAGTQRYLLPLATAWGEEHLAQGAALLPYALAKVRRGPRVGVLYDALHADGFPQALLQLMREEGQLQAGDYTVRGTAGGRREELDLPADAAVRRLGAEQSNSSLLVGEKVMVKTYRRLEAGIHPEIEVGRFLTDVARYPNTPPLLGAVERVGADGVASAYAAAFGFVANQGDGWAFTLDHLDRALEERRVTADPDGWAAPEHHQLYLTVARLLGQRTGELHRAFAIETDDPAFAHEPVGPDDLAAWVEDASTQVERGLAILQDARKGATEAQAQEIDAALALRPAIEAAVGAVRSVPAGLAKTRIHGDYHLGQVVVAKGDIMVLDFEGEPLRSFAERRAKGSPARDVAGMLRSFDYAAWASVFRFAESDATAVEQLLPAALRWRDLAQAAFLESYREAIGDAPSWPSDTGEADGLVRLFTVQKLFYELAYEAANRPGWLRIPLSGIRDLFGEARGGDGREEGGVSGSAG